MSLRSVSKSGQSVDCAFDQFLDALDNPARAFAEQAQIAGSRVTSLPFAAPDFIHLGIWPIIMGITMFIQMKMNPAPPDPVQAQIFTFMPIVFTFMLGSFPAGLVIFWAWNNTLSVIQQYVIMRRNGVKVELWDNLSGMFKRKNAVAKS